MDLRTFARVPVNATISRDVARRLRLTRLAEFDQDLYRAAASESFDDEVLPDSISSGDADRQHILLGVGIASDDDGEHAIVMADSTQLNDESEVPQLLPTSMISEVGRVLDALDVAAGGLRVLALPPPIPQYAPSNPLTGPGTRGTLGATVVTSEGRDAILTAGHVAPQDSVVRNSAGEAGNVVFSRSPSELLPAPTVDIAVVEPSRWPTKAPRVSVDKGTLAKAGDLIEIFGAAGGTKASSIFGFATFILVPSLGGQWESVYLTADGVTIGGDSGAPVVLAGTTQLVGHLVGASGNVTSFVQTLDVQLKESRTKLRPRM